MPTTPSSSAGSTWNTTCSAVGVDKTRVRFDITVEPSGPVPAFIVRRASEIVLDAATKGLRNQVAGFRFVGSDQPK